MTRHDKQTPAYILLLVLVVPLVPGCDKGTTTTIETPKVVIETYESGRKSYKVDAYGVTVEIRSANQSIGMEHHTDDDRVIITAGTTSVVIDDAQLEVNSVAFGSVAAGDSVLVDDNVVYVNDEMRDPGN